MALRTEDIERIFFYRLFITDLHNELTKRTEQKRQVEEKIILYRGKKLPNIILQLLKDNKGKLISMNGFLSTTKHEDTAKVFSGDDVSRDGYTSIIFKLHLHKFINYTGKPFADISNGENEVDDEQEVLFSLGTVWRIENIQQIDHLWYVTLINCTDLDDELCQYLTRLTDGYTLLSIGNLLQELDENDKAENFYRRTLRNDTNITDEQKGLLYFHIGMLRDKKKDHFGALDYLNEAIKHFPSCIVIVKKQSLRQC
jgi:tetratricopeptide (TPR) repeat protein